MQNMTNAPHDTLCELYPDHPDRCKVIKSVHRTFSSLSLIACLFVIFLIVLLKKYKLFVQKLVLAMVISAFFGCVSYLISDVNTSNEHTCRLQAVLTHFFDWAVLLWVFVITANMILVVKNYNISKNIPIYHAIVWLGALFWSIIPFFGNAYGKAGIFCWIKRDHTGYRFGTFYGPVLALLFLLIAMYIYICYTVVQSTKPGINDSLEVQTLNKRYRKELKPLIWYPIVYFVAMVPLLLYRIEDASHPTNPPNYGLIVLAAIFAPLIGTANAFVFTIVNASLKEVSWVAIKNAILNFFRRESHVKVREVEIIEGNVMESSGYGTTSGVVNEDFATELAKY